MPSPRISRTRRRSPPRVYRRERTRPPAENAPDNPIIDLLRRLVVDNPRGGAFYQVQFRDKPAKLARDVLADCGADRPTQRQVDAYMHLLAAGRYNSERYGTRSTSISYPSRWLVPGLGVGLRVAWLPRNQDALDAYLRGGKPECVVDRKTGAALTPATSYGLIWCPPVEIVDDEPTTEPFCWECGSTTLDPPPLFMEDDTDAVQ